MAGLPEGDGIDQVDVTRHQPGEGLVGLVIHKLPQQCAVIGWLHLRISVRRPAKADKLFAAWLSPFLAHEADQISVRITAEGHP